MSAEQPHRYVPEPASVSGRFVGWSALGAMLLLGLSIGGLYGIYRTRRPLVAPAPQTFPQPRVDTTERAELIRLRDAQNKTLETWAWADGQHTLVQVPIERAMHLLVQKGGNAAYQPLVPPQAALSSPTAAAEQTTMQGGKEPSAAQAPGHPQPVEAPK